MALSINTNTSALLAASAASNVNRSLATSMERLSTGKRINSASDDAAGVAIASRLTAEVMGTNQAIRNAGDAQSLVDTTEGAHKEIVNILQRMREIAVQGATDTNATDDRTNLKSELDALGAELNRISTVTTWAGNDLLAADSAASDFSSPSTTTDFTFHVGSGDTTDSQITIEIVGVNTESLGLGTTHETDGTSTATDTLLVSSAANSIATITLIDTALAYVNAQRADLGAVSNRLDHTISNLSNMAINIESSRGRIEDADFAAESTKLANSQILQQASTAMLAQANASKQGVLSLLQR